MSRVGNFITKNFDRFTGEPFNAEVKTHKPDGAAYTDADVDNVLVFKNKLENGGGYAVRVKEGPINPRWFGAKGDGVTDDTAAIQAAINSLATMGGEIKFPKPTNYYKVTSTLVIDKFFVTISGDGKSVKIVNVGTSALFEVQKDYAVFKGISLHGNGGAKGVGATGTDCIHFNGGRHYLIDDVSIRYHGRHGVYCTGGVWTGSCVGTEIIQNGGDGFNSISPSGDSFSQNGNALSFIKTALSLNGGSGLNWKAAALSVNGCTLEGNSQYGLKIDTSGAVTNSAYGISITGNYTENNTLGEMYFKSQAGIVTTGLVIEGNYLYSVSTQCTALIKFEGPFEGFQTSFIGTNSYVIGGTVTAVIDGGGALRNDVYVQDSYARGSNTAYVNMGQAKRSSKGMDLESEQTITGTKLFNQEVRLGNAKKFRAFLADGTTLRDLFYMSGTNQPRYLTSGNGLQFRTFDGTTETVLAELHETGTLSLQGLVASKPVFTDANKLLTTTGNLQASTLYTAASITLTKAQFGSKGELFVMADAGTASLTITLPSLADMNGLILHVLKYDTSTVNTVTVTGAANIDDAATDVLYDRFTVATYYCTGNAGQYYRMNRNVNTPVPTSGSAVKFDRARDYGTTTALTAFTLDLTGGRSNRVATVFATGYGARPTPLNASYIKIASEPASYDSTKELMIMMRYISSTKVITTITQY